MAESRPVFRVPLYVEVDASGGDFGDAAQLATLALRRLAKAGPIPVPLRDHPDLTVQIAGAFELSVAVTNGALRVVPQSEARPPEPLGEAS